MASEPPGRSCFRRRFVFRSRNSLAVMRNATGCGGSGPDSLRTTSYASLGLLLVTCPLPSAQPRLPIPLRAMPAFAHLGPAKLDDLSRVATAGASFVILRRIAASLRFSCLPIAVGCSPFFPRKNTKLSRMLFPAPEPAVSLKKKTNIKGHSGGKWWIGFFWRPQVPAASFYFGLAGLPA